MLRFNGFHAYAAHIASQETFWEGMVWRSSPSNRIGNAKGAKEVFIFWRKCGCSTSWPSLKDWPGNISSQIKKLLEDWRIKGCYAAFLSLLVNVSKLWTGGKNKYNFPFLCCLCLWLHDSIYPITLFKKNTIPIFTLYLRIQFFCFSLTNHWT